MIMCIILGMGMPVAAAYVLTAMLAAPTLINLGVSEIAAHLFIVYFSIISAITPPVAVASFAAAGIAKANPTTVGFEAVDRKSTRLNSSHVAISYAVFCWNKKKIIS